jgi:hypothetical protein
MEREFKLIFLIGVSLAAVGCGDSSSTAGGGSGGTGGRAGSGGGAGGQAGGAGVPGTPALPELGATPRYSVVSSDFSSSSISMLDEDFVAIDDSWLTSGTTYPGLVATLSGDVVLPNRQAGDGTFAVIDRFMTDVVSRFFVPSGNLNGQVRTHGDVGDSGFSSNPQDFVFVDEQSAWVPRYDPNLNSSAPAENQGNDLVEVNPDDMDLTGARIDLSSLNTAVTVNTPGGPVEVDVFARPSRGVLVGSTLVVGLDRISANFDAAGSGMVAVVDLEDQTVAGFELPGFQSCGNTGPVPGAPTKVVVACVGFAAPFGDEPQVRASSGIALLNVGESGVTIDRVWRVADHPSEPIAVNSVVAIDERRVVGVATGDFATTVDELYLLDLFGETQGLVHASNGSFVIGLSAYDPDSEMLYVPDVVANAVVEFAAGENGFTEVGSTQIAPGLGLPPTKVYRLD